MLQQSSNSPMSSTGSDAAQSAQSNSSSTPSTPSAEGTEAMPSSKVPDSGQSTGVGQATQTPPVTSQTPASPTSPTSPSSQNANCSGQYRGHHAAEQHQPATEQCQRFQQAALGAPGHRYTVGTSRRHEHRNELDDRLHEFNSYDPEYEHETQLPRTRTTRIEKERTTIFRPVSYGPFGCAVFGPC